MKTNLRFVLCLFLMLSLSMLAQNPPGQKPSDITPMDQTPTFRVNVVSRTARAVNYRHRGGATKVDFKGTELMPKANGEAKVESKQGYIEIEVEFDEVDKATKFGNEYLTYVMWAITPEGRAVNLGEVLLNGNRSKLNVTTDLQAFALIITAEPYYAVRQPSNLVVMENVIRQDTAGATQAINAKYDLLERGGYVPTGTNFEPVIFNSKFPLEFYEARNALRIAQLAGAEQYAGPSYQKAVERMKQVDEYSTRKDVPTKPMISISREVVQTAEDAREIALKRREQERLDNERRAAAAREEASRLTAEDEARRRAVAEQQSTEESRRRAEAESASAAAREQQRLAELQAAEDARRRAEAEAASKAAQLQQQQSQMEAERNRAAAEAAERERLRAEREKEELRARLLNQLNAILETRDTARGLIVNMSDVLFDTARYTLRPAAREKLAKISGIVLAYPELKLEIEGHTDSVGSEAYNQKLSEQRAKSVGDYLKKQGIPEMSVTTRGFGETMPVADNSKGAGRQQNRRVELVVSGEVIGTRLGGTQQQQQAPPPRPQPR
ncbi:MAG TPA: OmpA family protein [Terriglobales bacterium]|nr:OmpA family protein [Terriglobales bacterium]